MPLTTTDAAQAVTDARKTFADLEERVLNGDTRVTQNQLDEARKAIEFAELRERGAQRGAERAEIDRQRAEAASVREAVIELRGSARDRARAAYSRAVDALTELVDAMGELRGSRSRLDRRIAALGLAGGQSLAQFEGRLAALGIVRDDIDLTGRDVVQPGADYAKLARLEALGEEVRPHALSSDAQFAEYDARRAKAAEAEAAREAEHNKRVERGIFVGSHFERIDDGD